MNISNSLYLHIMNSQQWEEELERKISRWRINESWTLFLDRDGTINKLLVADYVKSWSSFEFIDGVLDAIPVFTKAFNLTLIATNQQGVGKNLMTEKTLREIHILMLEEITMHGGYIDEIYYCPDLAQDEAPCRKPLPGMGIQAASDFPEIDFRKSIMIGDAISDMQFGKNLGMKTIMLSNDHSKLSEELKSLVDLKLPDLATFASLLVNTQNLSL